MANTQSPLKGERHASLKAKRRLWQVVYLTKRYWYIIAPLLLIIYRFILLEFKVGEIEKDLSRFQDERRQQVEDLRSERQREIDDMKVTINGIRETTDRLEGQLADERTYYRQFIQCERLKGTFDLGTGQCSPAPAP